MAVSSTAMTGWADGSLAMMVGMKPDFFVMVNFLTFTEGMAIRGGGRGVWVGLQNGAHEVWVSPDNTAARSNPTNQPQSA
jgi:hypothetical protein